MSAPLLPLQIQTGDAHATIIELSVARLICQPLRSNEDHDDETPIWKIALRGAREADVEGHQEPKRHIYHLLGEYMQVENGYFIAGAVNATFTTNENKPTPDSNIQELEQFLSLHAFWANQAMWDHLATALRTLLALIPHAGQEIAISPVPPQLLLAPFTNSDSTD